MHKHISTIWQPGLVHSYFGGSDNASPLSIKEKFVPRISCVSPQCLQEAPSREKQHAECLAKKV